ncbi:MAG: hypothetical protein FJW38_08025 [Acidobacteria bacterium]|nr:hypothetical protein [Acidobacteriota bacterium]
MQRVFLFLFLPLLVSADLPLLEPVAQGVFPGGLRRGSESSITIRGRNLQQLKRAVISGDGVSAEIVDASAYLAKITVRASATTEPGRRDLRLIAPHGSTLTWIDISDVAELTEREPNTELASANQLTFPALVNGVITAADYDYFRFDASARQTLTFELLATRNGSPLDGVLELLDTNGKTVEYCDDHYAFKDPRIIHTFNSTGTYYLRVYGTGESGSENSDYRLIAGAMPHADFALPAGGRRGSTVEITLHGVNLDHAKELVLGNGIARATAVRNDQKSATFRMAIPLASAAGVHSLHIQGAALPIPFVLSDGPELTVSPGTARRRQDPMPVELGTTINGVIDSARAADYFVIRVDQPKQIVLSVESMKLGYLLDPIVLVYEENGTRIAWQDDPTTNTGKEPANLDPHLTVALPKEGRYTVAIRDSQFRGDASYLYRLTVKEAVPDFSVRVVGAHTTLYRGRDNIVNVRVRRLEGWKTPVEVWADNLPRGVTARSAIAEPKNTSYTGTCGERHYLDGTNVELIFKVEPDAKLDLNQVTFRARGAMNGREVEREARARYWKSRIRVTGDAAEPALFATIADLPGVVFQTPERSATGRVTAIVTRLDNSNEPMRIEGEGVTPLDVPAGTTRADVVLTKPGDVTLYGLVSGKVIGQSAPIRTEIRK